MIPAYNKKRCAAFPFETGIHFRRKTDFFPEEDTTMSYSEFEPEPTRLQAEGHSHHTAPVTNGLFCAKGSFSKSYAYCLSGDSFFRCFIVFVCLYYRATTPSSDPEKSNRSCVALTWLLDDSITCLELIPQRGSHFRCHL
ncbi:hypothetical protein TNCV_716051 [Trichonephila clavipes]|nr:hypothetical protein TNCV_716051 [Trichonephila clavipes]